VRELLPIASFFVIATAPSLRVAKTIAEEAERHLDRHRLPRLGVHGVAEGRWVCLDFAEIVVHIFDRESRRHYDLENLWAGAPRVPYEPPAE
jgi:ribosome-associated protein